MKVSFEIQPTRRIGCDPDAAEDIKKIYDAAKANPTSSNGGTRLRAAAMLNQLGMLEASEAEASLGEVRGLLDERMGVVETILGLPSEKRSALGEAVDAVIRAARLIGPLGEELTEEEIGTIVKMVLLTKLSEVFTITIS